MVPGKPTCQMKSSQDISPFRSEAGGLLNTLRNRLSPPFPVANTQYVIVDTALMAAYFASLRNAMIVAIYPDERFLPTDVITADHFTLVCRYLMKSRIDHVYAAYSGYRSAQRIAIPQALEVPKALAVLVNGIGTYICQGGAFMACPQPEVAPADDNQALSNVVTQANISSFVRLVQGAKVRGFVRTECLSSTTEGTAWWLLSARQASNTDNLAVDSNTVAVFGVFKEWTSIDGVLCAIAQRQYDGLLGGDTALKWSTDYITGLAGLRRSFNLNA